MISRPFRTSLLVLAGLSQFSDALADDPARIFQDPFALYGPSVHYDILRDGEKVGNHEISFTRQDGSIVARTHADISVPFLFLTGYRFDYHSTSVWEGDMLTRLEAQTDDDGTRSDVTIMREGQELVVTGPTGTLSFDQPLPPTEHWSLAFVQQPEVLNTITGHINRITTTKLGSAFVPAANGIIRADRYRLDGDIRLETWYDSSGRWLGMRFAGEDGSTIEYRCRDCPAQMAKAQ